MTSKPKPTAAASRSGIGGHEHPELVERAGVGGTA